MLVGITLTSDRIGFVITLFPYILTQLLVVHLVAVLALNVCAKFHLDLTLFLDSLVGELNGIQHLFFRYLFHFTLHHHDIIHRGGYHNIQIDLCHLALRRVNHELPVDTGHAHL